LPAVKVAHGPVTTTAGLAPELIERVMRDKENELLYCYWGILKDKPGLQGRVVITAKVGPDGKVKSAADQGSDIASPNLILCVAKTLEAGELEFPPTGVAGTFVYTLTFSPG
ncbi:MAG TPA: AgmX/PglI C-terminal domain-containing protein, partial [Polyangiaceae bacterium]